MDEKSVSAINDFVKSANENADWKKPVILDNMTLPEFLEHVADHVGAYEAHVRKEMKEHPERYPDGPENYSAHVVDWWEWLTDFVPHADSTLPDYYEANGYRPPFETEKDPE